MVVGGGISGIQAALDLATSGYKVYLVEKAPTIGGKMAQLDKTFPTNDCSMCIESPKFIECDRHPNIEILTYTEVDHVEGEAGDFTVSLTKKPRYIDESVCTGCTTCVEYCPSIFPTRSTRISPTTRPSISTSLRRSRSCLISTRSVSTSRKKCSICVGVCKNNAIDLHQAPEKKDIKVGAIVLSPGYGTSSTLASGATTATGPSRTWSPASTSSGCCAPPAPTRGDPPPVGQEAPAQDRLDPLRRLAASARGRQQLLLLGLLLLHPEAGDPDQGPRRRRRGDDLSQRHSLSWKRLRAVLSASRQPARGQFIRSYVSIGCEDPGDEERDHPLLHPGRRACKERSSTWWCSASGCSRPHVSTWPSSSASSSTLTGSARPTPEPDRDDPPGRLRQRRLPGPGGHPRVGGDGERRQRPDGRAARGSAAGQAGRERVYPRSAT